jgi:hypothetical protein
MITLLLIAMASQAQTYLCDTLNLSGSNGADRQSPIDPYQVQLVYGHAEVSQPDEKPLVLSVNFDLSSESDGDQSPVYEKQLGETLVVRFSLADNNFGYLRFVQMNPLDNTREALLETYQCSLQR